MLAPGGVPIDELLIPELQHQQRPQPAGVLDPVAVLRDQPLHGQGVDDAAGTAGLPKQGVAQQLVQFAPQPRRDRGGEPHFGPFEQLRRQVTSERIGDQALASGAALLEARWQPGDPFDEPVVEQRRPRLK